MTAETVKIETPDSRATSAMLAALLIFPSLELRRGISFCRPTYQKTAQIQNV
jgi:hypothetical protein